MKKILFASIVLIFFFVVGFVDPYARRIGPFNSVPTACAENQIGYSMTLHKLYICTNIGYTELDMGGAGSYAPIGATYITQTADANLTNEQALSGLATGLLKNTTTTGILSIATASDLPSGITYSKLTLTNGILNADINSSAAIAYSKLNLTGAILNADLAGSIAYSKLALTGTILNADLAGSITYSKLSLTNSIVNGDIVSLAWSKITSTPTTFSGYGISDTSANLATAITDELGSGKLIFSAGTLNITAAKTLNVSNTLTFTGTDSSSIAFGAGGTVAYTNISTLSSLASIGTITTGVWNGTLIAGTYGGTGVNNGTKTFTYLKNISFTAADDTGVYTLPTGTKTLVDTTVATLGSLANIGGTLQIDTTAKWLGINVTPAARFHVKGDAGISGADASIRLGDSDNSNSRDFDLADGAISYGSLYLRGSTTQNGSPTTILQTWTSTGASTIPGTLVIGGTPSIAGNATLNTGSKDTAGKLTATGTGASTAVITFSTAFARAPACIVTNETTANLVRPVSTTTTLTMNATIVNGDSLSYVCMEY